MILPPRRLLIIKPSSFGDIVHALPVLAVISRSWPETLIDWLVKEEWAELLLNHTALNEVLLFPKNFAGWRRLQRTIRERRYDVVIDLQGLLRSGVASLLTGASTRVGFADSREGSRWCYTKPIQASAEAVHAVDRGLDLLRQLGLPSDQPATFPLPVSVEARRWADSLWTKEQIRPGEPTVVIHPAARWQTKRWMSDRFARVADHLSSAIGARVLLIAGKDQTSQADEFLRHVRRPIINLSGRTTLLQLAALLRAATLLISNDSGPMHLAAALGTPVVAPFGPTDPIRVGPYGPGHAVIKKNVDCAGCGRQACARDLACLKSITVDEVVDAALPFLTNLGSTKNLPSGRPDGENAG